MKKRIYLSLIFFVGLLLAALLWRIYKEFQVRNQEPVVKLAVTQTVTEKVVSQPTIVAPEVQSEPTEIPEKPESILKKVLSSENPVSILIDLGDGNALTSVWGKANFFKDGVSPEVSMSYESGGIETMETVDGTLVTQVHSGYWYDEKLFAADIVDYVWDQGMYEKDGQRLIKSLIGKTVLLCQSTDGSITARQSVKVDQNCPDAKVFRISAAAMIEHDSVSGYSQSMMQITEWMAGYEAGNTEDSEGFNDRTDETWIMSTCLYRYNDQLGEGNTFTFGRLVIGFEYLGEW